jgi:hypothetical protein
VRGRRRRRGPRLGRGGRDDRLGRRCRSGRRRRATRGQEGERVEVALVVVAAADAEVDVGLAGDRVGALADRSDALALRDVRAARDGDGSELQQRDGEPVGGPDRDRAAAVRDRADEADVAGDGRAHHRADRPADVDAAMLTAGVRVRAERERSQELPVDGPGPRSRGGGRGERSERADDEQSAQIDLQVAVEANVART